MNLDALCVGAATLDRVAIVERYPGLDDRVLSDPFVVAGGGPAATAAVTLSRLGVRVGFCGVVGDDAAGRAVRDGLEAEGVDVSALRTNTDVRTTESMILVERGSAARTIVTTKAPSPEVPDVVSAMRRAPWVHVDQIGYQSVRSATSLGGDGPLVSVDGGNAINGLSLLGVELYVPTAAALRLAFPAADTADSMTAARRAGARSVVATDGSNGSYVLDGDSILSVPSFPIVPLSTMGAGDVFHGAMLHGLLAGRPLLGAVRWASAVAAMSCRAIDGRSAIPSAAETEQFLDAATASSGVA